MSNRKGDRNMTPAQEQLLKDSRIDISGYINNETGMYVREAILRSLSNGKPSPEIMIHITSPGGGGTIAADIYDMIKFYPGKTVGVVHGTAHSAAATILQACDWRVATAHSSILIHNMKHDGTGIDIDTLEDPVRIQELINVQLRRYRLFAFHTRKPEAEIRRVCGLNRPMTADEALDFGLIDQIITKGGEIKHD